MAQLTGLLATMPNTNRLLLIFTVAKKVTARAMASLRGLLLLVCCLARLSAGIQLRQNRDQRGHIGIAFVRRRLAAYDKALVEELSHRHFRL